MQRKRSELVPIAEALADLPGPVQAIRKTPPPARHCFTVADQVDQLVGASEPLGLVQKIGLVSKRHRFSGEGEAQNGNSG